MTMSDLTSWRERAAQLDLGDPLASFADAFLPMAREVSAYLDGNSSAGRCMQRRAP